MKSRNCNSLIFERLSFCNQIRQWGKMHTQNIFFSYLKAIPSDITAKWSTDPLLYCKKITSQKFSKIFCQYNIPFDSASYRIRWKADCPGSLEPNFQAAFQCLLNVSDFKCLHNLFLIPYHWKKSSLFSYFLSTSSLCTIFYYFNLTCFL